MSGSFLERTRSFMRSIPQSFSPNAKLILVAAFTYADDEGRFYAGADTLAETAALARSTAFRALDELTEAGALQDDGWEVHSSRSRSKRRRITLAEAQAPIRKARGFLIKGSSSVSESPIIGTGESPIIGTGESPIIGTGESPIIGTAKVPSSGLAYNAEPTSRTDEEEPRACSPVEMARLPLDDQQPASSAPIPDEAGDSYVPRVLEGVYKALGHDTAHYPKEELGRAIVDLLEEGIAGDWLADGNWYLEKVRKEGPRRYPNTASVVNYLRNAWRREERRNSTSRHEERESAYA